jgi:hypothetical protein
MATLIPDDRTLATMSALATLADRGEEPTLAAIAAEIRNERTWLARATHRADPRASVAHGAPGRGRARSVGPGPATPRRPPAPSRR